MTYGKVCLVRNFVRTYTFGIHLVLGSNVHKMGSVSTVTSEIFAFGVHLFATKKRIRSGSKVLVAKDGGLGLRISFYWLLASIHATYSMRIQSGHFSPFTLADVATRFGHDFLLLLVDVKVLQTRVGEIVLDGENLGWIKEF